MRISSEQSQKNPVISEDARLRVITLLTAFLGVTTMAPTGLSGGGTIPMCKQLRGHKTPDDPPFLHGKEAEGKIVCIVDGDTFDVKLDDGPMTRVRLWGVDCAESSFNDKCMKSGRSDCANEVDNGKKASQRVQIALSGNERVTLEPPYKNNGNRLLAYFRLQNGIDFGRLLVKSCLCHSEYDHKRKKDYQQAAHNCSR